MAEGRITGPQDGARRGSIIDAGTLALCATPAPGPVACGPNPRRSDLYELQDAINQLQATAINFAGIAIEDHRVRQGYLREIRRMADGLLREVGEGLISPRQAAEVTNGLRNDIMAAARMRSTPLGQALAEQLKRHGKSLEALLDHYAMKRFGKSFAGLAQEAARNEVYLDVVRAAGRDRSWVAPALSRAAKVGRGLVVVSVGISVWEVATAEDKARAAGREASSLGAGLGGAALGGAVAGLACGPGAPVCVGLIIFVSGAVAAWGGGAAFDWLTESKR